MEILAVLLLCVMAVFGMLYYQGEQEKERALKTSNRDELFALRERSMWYHLTLEEKTRFALLKESESLEDELEYYEKRQAVHGFSSLSTEEKARKYDIEKILDDQHRESTKWVGATTGIMAGSAWSKYMSK